MILTLGNIPVVSKYLSVALFSALIQGFYGKEIFLPVCKGTCWYGWHMLWDFYFYNVCSSTPLIFSVYGFSAAYTLDLLRVRITFLWMLYWWSPALVFVPHSVSFIGLGLWPCQAHMLEFPLGLTNMCFCLHSRSDRTSLVAHLFSAYLEFHGLWVPLIVFWWSSIGYSWGVISGFPGGGFYLVFPDFCRFLLESIVLISSRLSLIVSWL